MSWVVVTVVLAAAVVLGTLFVVWGRRHGVFGPGSKPVEMWKHDIGGQGGTGAAGM